MGGVGVEEAGGAAVATVCACGGTAAVAVTVRDRGVADAATGDTASCGTRPPVLWQLAVVVGTVLAAVAGERKAGEASGDDGEEGVGHPAAYPRPPARGRVTEATAAAARAAGAQAVGGVGWLAGSLSRCRPLLGTHRSRAR